MNVQQKRKIILFEDNINKIIEDGIKPNLQRLCRSSAIIKSNNCTEHRLSKECMNARLTIQQLRNNLAELEKCYFTLKELKPNKNDFENEKIISIKSNVLKEINAFIKINEKLEKSRKLYREEEEIVNGENVDLKEKIQERSQFTELEKPELSKASQNYQEIQFINEELKELHHLMGKFGEIVHEQGVQLDCIEENISNAATNIHEGTKSLAKAASTSVVPIACAAVGASVFGPIGALISFKVSTGIISAIGGSALSYSLASYIKNKRRKQLELELEKLDKIANDNQQSS